MLSSEFISDGKSRTKYTLKPLHEHDDCIRIAYEWLDAQTNIKGKMQRTYAIKHIIEKWAGRYVSTSDVEVAAQLHPRIRGKYPHFNISAKLVAPSHARLKGIGEAGTQSNYSENYNETVYSRRET